MEWDLIDLTETGLDLGDLERLFGILPLAHPDRDSCRGMLLLRRALVWKAQGVPELLMLHHPTMVGCSSTQAKNWLLFPPLTAAKYFWTLASGNLRISLHGISRSSCFASCLVRRWCGGIFLVEVDCSLSL